MTLLTKNYSEGLLDEVLLRYLHRNVVPTTSTLISEYESLLKNYPKITQKSFLSSLTTDYSRYDMMRADTYNQIWRRSNRDFTILYKSLFDIVGDINSTSQSWSLFYSRILSYVDQLEDRVDQLLLSKDDTDGYFTYVQDKFLTNELVDLTNTTAEVDTSVGATYLPPARGGTDGTFNTRSIIDPTIMSLTPRVRHPRLLAATVGAGVTREDIVKDNNKPWYMTILTEDNHPSVNMDLILDLGKPYTFNTIDISVFNAISRSAMLVTTFYSADGIDWIKASDTPTKSVSASGIWNFASVDARYIRFIFVKSDIDQLQRTGKYLWTIGVNSVKIYSNVFATGTATASSAIFRSTQHSITDTGDNPNGFNKVLLDACEVLPPNTDINYSVSIDGTNFVPIGNVKRKLSGYPPIIDFGDESTVYSIHSYDIISSSVDAKQISTDLSIPDVVTHFTINDAFVNYQISASDFSSLVRDSIQVFRNVGIKNDSLTVRSHPRGWKISSRDASLRSCIVLVLNPAGINIDFGPGGIMLDGARVKGIAHITSGVHSLETSLDNWHYVTDSAKNDEELETVDPLFPYNHKLLIEGFVYDDASFVGKYQGVDIFASDLMIYKPIYSYNVLDSDNLEYYTYVLNDDDQLVFVVKTDTNYDDYGNEKFEFIYKLRNQSFTSITFQATLTTQDPARTPILNEYKLRIG